jgi:hypothetical protein
MGDSTVRFYVDRFTAFYVHLYSVLATHRAASDQRVSARCCYEYVIPVRMQGDSLCSIVLVEIYV